LARLLLLPHQWVLSSKVVLALQALLQTSCWQKIQQVLRMGPHLGQSTFPIAVKILQLTLTVQEMEEHGHQAAASQLA
jgi:hypothetical protein